MGEAEQAEDADGEDNGENQKQQQLSAEYQGRNEVIWRSITSFLVSIFEATTVRNEFGVLLMPNHDLNFSTHESNEVCLADSLLQAGLLRSIHSRLVLGKGQNSSSLSNPCHGSKLC